MIDGLNGLIAEDIARLSDSLLSGMDWAADNARLQQAVQLNRQLVAQKALHQTNMQHFADLYASLLSGPAHKDSAV